MLSLLASGNCRERKSSEGCRCAGSLHTLVGAALIVLLCFICADNKSACCLFSYVFVVFLLLYFVSTLIKEVYKSEKSIRRISKRINFVKSLVKEITGDFENHITDIYIYVDREAAMVEEMLRQSQNLPPISSTSTSHPANMANRVKVLSTCVFLGFDVDSSLNIVA
ncbi:protein RIK [Senna tora]|uniref:Protein RIK n=1 Tax=Senna tora TaxID=362788 RepID=A0A834SYZ6_9FABA|nr:protein RIK [Senna tora]